jgi:hypothetical protein
LSSFKISEEVKNFGEHFNDKSSQNAPQFSLNTLICKWLKIPYKLERGFPRSSLFLAINLNCG